MKKKIVLLMLAFVLLAVPAAWLQLREGVMLDGRFFVQKTADLYISGNDSVTISRAKDGAELFIRLSGETANVQVNINQDEYGFHYDDGRQVTGYAGKWLDELVDADGAPIHLEDSIVVQVGNESSPSLLTREYSLSNVLYHMLEGICEQRGHLLVILMALFVYALGIASFFWPQEVHFFGSRWLYVNAELSDAGIAVQKIAGAACAVVGVVLLYAPLFW